MLLVSCGVSVASVLKIMLVLPILLAQVSFYVFSRKIIKLDRPLSLLVSLIYGISICSLDFLYKSSLVWGYALLPLLLTCYIRSLQTRSLRLIILSSAILVLVSVHPFVVAISLTVLTLYTMLHLSRSHLWVYLRAVGIYALFGGYFVVPLIMASLSNGALSPAESGHYILTEQAVEYLSSSNFFHTLLFTRDVLPTVDSYFPEARPYFVIWVLSATLLLTLGVYGLLCSRIEGKDKVFYGALLVVFLGLTQGTGGLFGGVYSALLFDLPAVGWMFRSPPKWQLYAFFPFAVLIGYLLKAHKRAVILVLFAATVAVIPTASQCLFEVYTPVEIPKEHSEINQLLADLDDDYRVLWYPSYQERPLTWSASGHVQPFDVLSSTKDTMSPRWSSPYVTPYLYSYAYGELELADAIPLFTPLGVKYLVFHNDATEPQRSFDDRVLPQLNQSDGFTILYSSGEWSLFQIDGEAAPPVSVVDNLCLTNTGLEGVQWLNQHGASVFITQDFLALPPALQDSSLLVAKGDISTDLTVQLCQHSSFIAPFSHTYQRDADKAWSRASVCDLTHGEWHPVLEAAGIRNWEFDYGEGIAFTRGSASLEMPFSIDAAGPFYLLCRYLGNIHGSGISIRLDGEIVKTIDTQDQVNSFAWDETLLPEVGQGGHSLTIQSKGGFNVVNFFALIPQGEYERVRASVQALLEDKTFICLLEAETDLSCGGSDGQTLMLGSSPAWRDLTLPREGFYEVALRLSGNASVTVDGKTSNVSGSQLEWVYLEPQYLAAGSHRIEVAGCVDAVVVQSFEEGQSNSWKSASPAALSVHVDNTRAASGNSSLKAEVSQGDPVAWRIAHSDFIDIEPGQEYRCALRLAAQDANGLHAKIRYFDQHGEPVGTEVMLMAGQSGSFGFTEFSTLLAPPAEARCLRVMLLVKSNPAITSYWWLDDLRIEPAIAVDKVVLHSTDGQHQTVDDLFTSAATPAEVIEYTEISPTRRTLRVNATAPFMLSFAETYDPLWTATVNGREYESIPLYSLINGFWIEDTGELQITLEYKAQTWFTWGAIVSIVSLAGAIAYFIYDWIRGRRRARRGAARKAIHPLFQIDASPAKPPRTRRSMWPSVAGPGQSLNLASALSRFLNAAAELAIGTCIALLAAAAIALTLEKADLAGQVALYAFYFLSGAVLALLIKVISRTKEGNEEGTEGTSDPQA